MKKYKNGDKVICIRAINKFKPGEYFTISYIDNDPYKHSALNKVYYTIDHVSFMRNDNGVDEFTYYFGTLKDLRKLKLEKLKV